MADTFKAKRARSSAYPYIDLQSAISAIKKIYKEIGEGDFNRQFGAKALGHPTLTGPAARKVAALVQFGLIERHADAYRLATLGRRIASPRSEDDEGAAVKEAFFKPKLYRALHQAYVGKSLPNMLESLLTWDYGIQQGASASAASGFKKSAEFAGFLVNGVIMGSAPAIEESPDQSTAEHGPTKSQSPEPDGAASDKPIQRAPGEGEGEFLPTITLKNGILVIVPLKLFRHALADSFRSHIDGLEQLGAGGDGENKQTHE